MINPAMKLHSLWTFPSG